MRGIFLHSWLAVWLLGCLLLAGHALPGQNPVPSTVANSWLTLGLRPVQTLEGEWLAPGGAAMQVPFVVSGRRQMEFTHLLSPPPDSVCPDTLYLYLQGLAWSAEVEFNGKLLGITEDPFGEFLFPIYKEWLDLEGGQNWLHVRLGRKGPVHEFYPEIFLGITRKGYLLVQDSVRSFPQEMPMISAADSAVVYAAWPVDTGFGSEMHAFLFALAEIGHSGCRNLWFPFEPPSRFLQAAASLGFKRVAKLDAVSQVAWYNYYPTGGAEFPRKFWKDARGERTEFAGGFFPREEPADSWVKTPVQTPLVLFLLFPLVGVIVFRSLSNRLFDSVFEYLSKAKIYLDLIRQNKFLKGFQTYLINAFCMLTLATGMASYAYYLQCTGQFEKLNVLTSDSLAYQMVYPGNQTLAGLVFWSLIFVGAISFLKYSFVSLVSFVFRLKFQPSQIQNLDIFSSLPFNFLLILPAWFIFYGGDVFQNVLLVAWQAFFVVFFVRKWISTFQGLNLLSSVSLSLKILYICSLEILPWLILL